jgi:hypothetical protein
MDCPKRSDSSDDALSSDSAFGSPSKEYLERPQSPTEQAFHVMPSEIGVSDTMLGHVLVPEDIRKAIINMSEVMENEVKERK